MSSIKEMDLQMNPKFDLQESYANAQKDSSFQTLVKKLNLSSKEAMKITTKLQDSVEELKNCKQCKGLFNCQNALKGHVKIPEKREGRVSFSYTPCKYQLKLEQDIHKKEEKANMNMSARMKDIDVTGDKKRIDVIKYIDQYFEHYDYQTTTKGIYLHGNFGCGKTFLLSALLHELEIERHASVCIVYYPEILRELKDDWELYASRMKYYQTVDLLMLDDIGAERVTEWGRDEVLGTILQYRMEHQLPTFFSSNMSIDELEVHLAGVGQSKDTIKARRIIERIKQISTPKELISENRRS